MNQLQHFLALSAVLTTTFLVRAAAGQAAPLPDAAATTPAAEAPAPVAEAPVAEALAAAEADAAPPAPAPGPSASPPVDVPPAAGPTAPVAPAPAPTPTTSTPRASTPPASEVKFSGAPGKGATVEVGDSFSLNVRSRIQVRYQLDVSPEDDAADRELQQTVNIGTARLWFSGHAFTRKFTYMIQLAVAGRDYRDGATSPVYDAFVDYRAHRDLAIKVGQYFVPFDRLRTVREFALQMADRPGPVQQLTLDRDVGVTLYSDTFLADDSPLALRLGAFGGGGTNLSLGKEPGVLAVGRVELRPLGKIDDDSEGDLERRKKPAVAVGGAVAANWNTNRVRSTTGPTYAEGVVDYLHAAADVVFKWQGFALQGELLLRDAATDELEVPDGAAPEYSQSGRGWVVQASYVFDPPIEVVGRLSGMTALEGTDPAFVALTESTGQEVGAGVNYYLNDHKFKIQADWIAKMPSDYDFSRSQQAAHVQLDVTF